MEVPMTLLEQIEKQLSVLPPEKQIEALDFITFLQQRAQSARTATAEKERRKRLREAFETLAEMGTFADITNPVEWQRQIRKDRPLPGRDE
jgi:hypothetical protein